MNCNAFKKLYHKYSTHPIPREVCETAEFVDWIKHKINCTTCFDYCTEQYLLGRGVDVQRYPCIHMADAANFKCDEHPHPTECTKSVILWNSKFNEYYISPRGSTGDDHTIYNCPWCGTKLPRSRRYEWFEKIESMGLEPWEDTIPEEFHSEQWYQVSDSS